jgi:hypothetical protein
MRKNEIMNLEEEYEIIAARLELKDKIFKWEQSIFKKIAQKLKRLNISPLQAFEAFDENRDY